MKKQSYQHQKKENLILRALQNIFLLKIQNSNSNIKMTVTGVEAASTTSFVKVFLNVIPEEKKKEVVKDMNRKKSMVRKFLGDSLKDKLRTIPDLKFIVDDSLERMRRIEELLKEDATIED